ncbi:hypothetical protein D9M68_807390 [compost metagenome]
MFLGFFDELESAAVPEADVDHEHIELMLHQEAPPLAQGTGLAFQLDAQVAQQFLGDDAADKGIVVDEHDTNGLGFLTGEVVGPRQGICRGGQKAAKLTRI